MDINELRKKINEIDEQMANLFNERLRVASEIAEYKRNNNLPIFDQKREKEHLNEIKECTDEKYKSYCLEFFSSVMDISKAYQKSKNGKYGLLGEKLGHSYSPQIHKLFGGYDYNLFEVEKSQVETFMKDRDFDAINVTIPYKKTVIPLCDELDYAAKKIGSVNTIVKDSQGKLKGFNTDYYGFKYLLTKTNVEIENKKCLILGNGGVSQTIRAVLEDLGAANIKNVSRKGDINFNNLYEYDDYEIIVNATPVGMYPNNGESLVDLTKFKNLKGVFDVVYNPNKTKLILDAEKLNIPCNGGLTMLVAQAKKACEIFTDRNINDVILEDIINKIEIQMKNIILIGMPGCGKSTCGRELEKLTGRKFVDADEEITNKIGCSIPEFLANNSEDEFRSVETEVVEQLGKKSGIIIATGGGVVTKKVNYDLLHQNGVIIFLDREDIDELSTKGRPISKEKTTKVIAEERMPMYLGWSDFKIKCVNAKENAKQIAEVLCL